MNEIVRWHIGMSSASYAADPGSNLGVGDGTTEKIDRSSTCNWFGLRMTGFENDCRKIEWIGSFEALKQHKSRTRRG